MADNEVQNVVEFIKERAHSDLYAAYCRDLLCELIEIDTSIQDDLDRLAQNEGRVFDVLERELQAATDGAIELQRTPIDCKIAEHPYYSVPYYTCKAEPTGPLTCQETYKGRGNLFAIFEADDSDRSGTSAIYNAHIDTVAPWFGPKAVGPLIYGRGACDDKGQVVLLLAQVRLIEEVKRRFGLKFGGSRVYQFVIEEEMGGNGTLSAAMDKRFRGHEVIVHEITENLPHPANRGALWYQCTLRSAGTTAEPIQMWPFVVRALEREGAKLKAESNHPLFKPEHVQTNHGILGCYGEHPSAVNDHVAFTISVGGVGNPERLAMRMSEIIDAAVREYCQQYGDKTKQIDPETGQPKVQRHYKLQIVDQANVTTYRLDVYGKTGHMGAVAECDGAITKASVIMLALLQAAKAFRQVRFSGRLADATASEELVLEGGQGFVPSHSLEEVMTRLRAASQQGVREFCQFAGVRYEPALVEMHFGKLHNDAFASPVDCPAMQAFEWAFRAVGREWPRVTGWHVSCDARIYAKFGHNVVTFGPGTLNEAHSDKEFIDLRQMQEGLVLSVLQALRLGGAL